MRLVSADFDAEVAGTTQGDRLEVNVWRGPTLMAAGLPLASWSLDWSVDRHVQGQGTFSIADPDGSLVPWGMGDALAPGGSRLQLAWVSGLTGTRVPLSWWRIRRASPVQRWRRYTSGGTTVLVPGGGTVSVRADEITATAVLDRMDAESSPASGVTCLDEIRRLLAGIMPVTVDGSVVDADAPSDLVYGRERMDAVAALLDVVSARHRMGGDGTLEVVPAAAGTPVWTIAGGAGGVLLALSPDLSDDGVFNAAVSSSQTDAGRPLVGRAYVPGGPTKWGVGEPFGRVPAFHQAIATTQTGVDADAATVLGTYVSTAYVDIPVECVAHPAIQLWDTVTVRVPTTAGELDLVGQVSSMTLSGAATPAKRMALSVRVSAEAVEALAAVVRRG